jgi:hypothetical protein
VSAVGRYHVIPRGGSAVKLFEIESGRRYKYLHRDVKYFVTVKQKQDGRIGVLLDEGAGDDPVDLPQALVWLMPKDIHPL